MKWFKTTLIVSTVVLACTASAFAQGGRGNRGGGAFGRGGIGGLFGRGGPVSVLQREDVQKELALTDVQKQEVNALAESSRGNRGGGFDFRALRDMNEEERREAFAKMQEDREKQSQETREKVKDILNGQQNKRFVQLEFQYALRQGQMSGALAAAGIEVDEDDREKLREAQSEAQRRIRDEMAKIQLEAYKGALQSFVSEDEIEKLMGDAFAFESQGGTFGRGGGEFARPRGGERGGERGGGRRGRPSADEGSSDDEEPPRRSRRGR